MPATPLDIIVISDVICPWCFIGSRRLTQVLDTMRDEIEPRIQYRPFLLDATVPPEGADLRDRLRRKYGVDPEQMFARIEEAAQATGIPLDFTKVRRTPNTIPAHTLLRHAASKGTQLALSDALFVAYFLEGQDISQTEVLTRLASQHGFGVEEVERLLADPLEAEATRGEALSAAHAGVNGVPYFVFNNKLSFSGAQPAHVFRAAIQQAASSEKTRPT